MTRLEHCARLTVCPSRARRRDDVDSEEWPLASPAVLRDVLARRAAFDGPIERCRLATRLFPTLYDAKARVSFFFCFLFQRYSSRFEIFEIRERLPPRRVVAVGSQSSPSALTGPHALLAVRWSAPPVRMSWKEAEGMMYTLI